MVLVKCDCGQSTTSTSCYRCGLGASCRAAFIKGNYLLTIHSKMKKGFIEFNFCILVFYLEFLYFILIHLNRQKSNCLTLTHWITNLQNSKVVL